MRTPRALVASLLWVALLVITGRAQADNENLLAGASVVASSEVDRVGRVHDGKATWEGAGWNTTVTARLRGKDAYVTFDLGSELTIDALWIQADNDDDYIVDVSLDGAEFAYGWHSGPGSSGGLRSRFASGLGLHARFLRLRAEAGDGQYGVSELQAFETTPDPFPPELPIVAGVPMERLSHNAVLTFGFALMVFVGVSLKRFAGWLTLLTALLPLYGGFVLAVAIAGDLPVDSQTLSLLRGAVALAAAVAVAREAFGPERFAPDPRAVVATLAVCAVTAIACLYNVGVPAGGGDATPVSMAMATVLPGAGPESGGRFLWAGLLDPLLLVAMFIAIVRTFGIRTALVCAVIFGANDFATLGGDLASAPLRHDWLAFLGLGACALRTERWTLGGVLIGAAAAVRALPGFALVGPLIVAGIGLVAYVLSNKRLPSLATLREENRGVGRILLGAAVTILALAGLSLLIVPTAAWVDWTSATAQSSADVRTTHIALRSVIGGWGDEQADALKERAVLLGMATAALVAMVVLASKKSAPSQAAMLALWIVPVTMYPASHYLHFLCLLPMAATLVQRGEEEDASARAARAKVWLVLLGLCFAQYFATLELNDGLRIFVQSSMLIATMVAFLGLMVRRQPVPRSRGA